MHNLERLGSTMLALEKVSKSLKFCFPLFLILSFLAPLLLIFWIIFIAGSSVKEFVEACKKATGVDIKVEYLSRRPGDYAKVYSDPSKVRQELNWTARYTLQESLQIAWRWQKSHLNGYGLSNAMG